MGQSLDPKSRIEHARCLLGIGKYRKAQKILVELLSGRAELEPRDRSRIYTLLANLSASPVESISLHQKALDSCPHAAVVSGRGLLNVVQAYAMAGEVAEARRRLDLAERVLEETSETPSSWSWAIKGNILISLCDYQNALTVLRSDEESGVLEPIMLNNVAVCLEHVGNLSEACAHQTRVLEIVRGLGLMSAEVQSLANLGAFETKRGNVEEASRWFREATDFCTAIDFYREGDRANLPLLDADQAFLCMERGKPAVREQFGLR